MTVFNPEVACRFGSHPAVRSPPLERPESALTADTPPIDECEGLRHCCHSPERGVMNRATL